MGFIFGRALDGTSPVPSVADTLIGTVNIFRYGAGSQGIMRTLGQYMGASGATFGFVCAYSLPNLDVMLTEASQVLHGSWQRHPIGCRPQATRIVYASAATTDSTKSEFGLEKGRIKIHNNEWTNYAERRIAGRSMRILVARMTAL